MQGAALVSEPRVLHAGAPDFHWVLSAHNLTLKFFGGHTTRKYSIIGHSPPCATRRTCAGAEWQICLSACARRPAAAR